MRPALVRAILELYGESPVLDPMAGVGITLVEAILLGMNAVGVEHEKKFVREVNENIKHVRTLQSVKSIGNAFCLQGDARDHFCLNTSSATLIRCSKSLSPSFLRLWLALKLSACLKFNIYLFLVISKTRAIS